MGMSLDSVYFCGSTFENARLSAGAAIEVARAVASGLVKNAIAIVRPPGHHAEANRPMGFCIFDNVSIATKVCQADYPEQCRKVLIVDWYVLPLILDVSQHAHLLKGMSITATAFNRHSSLTQTCCTYPYMFTKAETSIHQETTETISTLDWGTG